MKNLWHECDRISEVNMKKIISLFIAVMLIFSIITPIYASNEEIQENVNATNITLIKVN